jgi:hypothetical protein
VLDRVVAAYAVDLALQAEIHAGGQLATVCPDALADAERRAHPS